MSPTSGTLELNGSTVDTNGSLLSSSASGPRGSTTGGDKLFGAAVDYEQLLTTLQSQHALALQQKDAEVASLQACVEMMMSENTDRAEQHLMTALRQKDDEATLAMAGKHKQLELMASLLQLREQQIEEFRQLCESQCQELDRLRASGLAAGALQTSVSTEPSEIAASVANEQLRALETELQELHRVCETQRLEIEDLRPHQPMVVSLREELEQLRHHHSQQLRRLEVERQQQREQQVSATSSQEEAEDSVALKMMLEVRRLRLRMEELESTVQEQSQQSAQLMRTVKEKTKHAEKLERELKRTRQAASSPGTDEVHVSSPQESMLHQGAHGFITVAEAADNMWSALSGDVASRMAMDGEVPQRGTPLRDVSWRFNTPDQLSGLGRHKAESSEYLGPLDTAALDISARVFSSRQSSEAHPESLWKAAPDSADTAAEAARQSRELFREMERLKLQMTDLEQIAECSRESRGSSGAASRRTSRSHALGTSALLAGPVPGSARKVVTSEDERASAKSGSRPPLYSEPVHSKPITSSDLQGSRWQYRPLDEGDPVDQAVALLLNDEASRYYSLRALICRLHAGTYLCGSRLMRLRVQHDHYGQPSYILASEDGGTHWTELAELLHLRGR
eukprot:TRINITY_DN29061_c0_g2_i1.p1 TRINITY_DN29061_c0_g2~~TRINITY_DN29061_c0_g2_i1.p1  ORF type:complete len:625 (-),score=165.17 TRINITY_DN29061_c0_g2_i1:372-2246(-)